MQPTDNPMPAPCSLQGSFLLLARLIGVELSAESTNALTNKNMALRDLQQTAERLKLNYRREMLSLDNLPDDAFPCLMQLKQKRFYLLLGKSAGCFQVLGQNRKPVRVSVEALKPVFFGTIHWLNPMEQTTKDSGHSFDTLLDTLNQSDKPDQPEKKPTPETPDKPDDITPSDHSPEHSGDSSWLTKQAKALSPKYAQVLLATLLVNVLTLSLPVFTHFVFDKVLPSYALNTLLVVSLGMGFVLVVDFILRWLRSYYVDDSCRIIAKNTEAHLLSRILELEKTELPESPGRITQMVQDFSRVKESVSSSVLLSALDIPFFVLFTFIIWLIGGPIVWIPLSIAVIILPLSFISYRRSKRRSEPQVKSQHEKSVFLHEVTQGLDTVRAMGAERRTLTHWRTLVATGSDNEFNSKQSSVFLTTLVGSASQIVVISTLIMGVFLIQSGSLAPGSLFACIILGSRAVAPLMNLTMVLNRINLSLKALEQLKELLADKTVEHKSKKQRLSDLKADLVIDDMSFTYPGDTQPTLRNINVQIKEGERVALIGASGTGKTTLMKLLQGDLMPTAGHIYVDNQDLSGVNLDDYRKHCAVAHQSPTVFRGTLRSNLSLGNEFASRDELNEVCHITCLDGFVRRCREGYNYAVRERGVNLSGGQQQALCLARTLLHGGSLFILDEPASAFDNLSESLFCERLPEYIKPNQTLILVTHRSSLLQLVDRIIVLAEGRIVADGARDEVLAKIRNVRQAESS